MTRVTFGTTCSPFLLAATLQHHLAKTEDAYPVTAKTLRKSMYVDCLLTGPKSEEGAVTLYAEANDISRAVSMKLHKSGSDSARLNEVFKQDTT